MTVLFIGTLPEPMTGQALACQVFLERLRHDHRVEVIDFSKNDFRQGFSSFSRAVEVLGVLRQVWRKRKSADVIYLTVSQSVAGNVKDLITYVLCFGRLHRMVIHLLGGAGMRRIMLGNRRLLRAANSFFLRRLGGVVVEGPIQSEIYRGVVPANRIHVVPNFAEDRLFTTLSRIERKFTQTRPLRLLFLSNLLPGKGHVELVEATLALDDRARAAVELDLAGGFESNSQKEHFLERIANLKSIRYHGVVHGDRKRALLDEAHVFCLPTYYAHEGQPFSILEAYASGCAVITTNHSGIPDVFRHEVNGFEVQQRSVPALKHAIEQAVAQPDRLRRMAMTNFELASTRYRTANFAEALSGLIERAARGV